MSTTIPAPSRRLGTRLVLPLIIVAGAAGALLWTGWQSLLPARTVEVVPVVVRAADPAQAGGGGAIGAGGASGASSAPARAAGPAIQAPGWIEPSPFPTMVPALVPGIVRSVLVLEGDAVAKDQMIAELYDEEATIALRLADAMLAETAAKREEMRDELARKSTLVAGGAVSAGEVARLKLRVGAMDAAVAAAEADRAMKALALERTKVRAPAAGVVMARLASPGMTAGGMQDAKPIVELYDPAQLQVRADVPLADAALLAVGCAAEIRLDVLPNRVFRGEVVRVVHQADIAKNTLQAKVRILDPVPQLRPEMLARVKIFAGSAGAGAGPGAGAGATAGAGSAITDVGGRQRIWASRACIDEESSPPRAMAVDALVDGRGVAQPREIALTGAQDGEWLEVSTGLRAGDLLVARVGGWPAPGERVRISESWREAPEEGSRANH